jgi:acetyl-CoA acyltransferase
MAASGRVVIAGYARSPFHFAKKGALAGVRPDELAGRVVEALVERTGVDPDAIEDVTLGCAFPEGEQGMNAGRLVGVLAGLPRTVAGSTINRFCGSSMQAVHTAAGSIAMGAGEAYVCAGVESMSRVPMGGFNPMPHPGLAERYPQIYISMGETAENVAERYRIPRERQEAFAVESQRKAAEAQREGGWTTSSSPSTTSPPTAACDPRRPPRCWPGSSPRSAATAPSPPARRRRSPTAPRGARDLRGLRPAARPAAARRRPLDRRRGLRARGDGHRAGAGDPQGARPRGRGRGRRRPRRAQRGVRQPGARLPRRARPGAGAGQPGRRRHRPRPPARRDRRPHHRQGRALLHRSGGRYAVATQCIGGGQGIATVLEAVE